MPPDPLELMLVCFVCMYASNACAYALHTMYVYPKCAFIAIQLAVPVNKSLLQACISMTLQRPVHCMHYIHQNRAAQINGDLNIRAVITNQIYTYSNILFSERSETLHTGS